MRSRCAIAVVCTVMALSLLAGCYQETQSHDPAGGIDLDKIDKIAFDFHFGFYDENLQPIELTTEEVAYFFELKARSRVEVEDEAGLPDPYDWYEHDEVGRPEEITTGEPPPQPYDEKCRKAGVPIPPAFAQSTWEEIGSLSKEQIFSDPEFNPLYIWRYKATQPAGICAATVRYKVGQQQDVNNKGANVQVVGVICQGRQTGNACFWATENDPFFGKRIEAFELTGDTIPTTTTFTGRDGTRGTKPLKCTFCHLGGDAFIVHPGTVLDGTGLTEPDDGYKGITDTMLGKRYTPISHKNVDNTNDGDKWGNPPWGDPDDGNEPDDCRSCHNFANVNEVWCRDVLQKTLGKTMPPPEDGRTSAERLPEFRAGLEILKRQCAAAGYDLRF